MKYNLHLIFFLIQADSVMASVVYY